MPVFTSPGENNTRLTLLSTICRLTRRNSIPSNEFGSSRAISVCTIDTSPPLKRSSAPLNLSFNNGQVKTIPCADYAQLLKSPRLETRNLHKYLRQAINDAFKAAGRRLQDYGRRQRGDVKHRELRSVAKITQLFQDQGYGFLATKEGREIYFHKDSVLNQAFEHLRVGTTVNFAEEQGDKGPQASSVRIVGKRGMQDVARKTEA